MKQVFVSSTCHDLIDLRAELRAFLLQEGFRPVMSDHPWSGFEVVPDTDSISSCLHNVRESDAVVVLLSRRYGPRLGKFGFDDVSATHLEYREAKASGKPIFMFVRRRLAAEFDLHRASSEESKEGLALRWVKKQDYGLFDLLEEHRRLEAGGDNNWYFEYGDSTEVKRELSQQFKASSAKYEIERMIEGGFLPWPRLSTRYDSSSKRMHFIIFNEGSCPMENVYVQFEMCGEWPEAASVKSLGDEEMQPVKSVFPGQKEGGHIPSSRPGTLTARQKQKIIFWVHHTGPMGHRVEDVFFSSGSDTNARIVLKCRRLLAMNSIDFGSFNSG